MRILSIETSCDETALSILEAEGMIESPTFKVLGNALLSQVKIHEQYGGVYPMLAKREHSRNLIPLLKKMLEESGFGISKLEASISKEKIDQIKTILNREPELLEQFLELIPTLSKPPIDLVVVTQGPGLEPALWVGVNFAKALSFIWDIPLLPVNHMEGHIASVLLGQNKSDNFKFQISKKVEFPLLALLVSGGHTELILAKQWGEYRKIGETKDDAVGEAFDKVARILGLPYPGGPQISHLADEDRKTHLVSLSQYKLPRPMIHSKDLHFSFSGLKTAVLYMVEKIPELTEDIKRSVAREFEDAAIDVLISKTKKALEETGAQNLIVAGGVSANRFLRESFEKFTKENNITLYIPELSLSTDNAIMIALAGFIQHTLKKETGSNFVATGNLSL